MNGEAYIKFSDDFYVLNPLRWRQSTHFPQNQKDWRWLKNADGLRVRELQAREIKVWLAGNSRSNPSKISAVQTKGIETVTISVGNDIPAVTTGNKNNSAILDMKASATAGLFQTPMTKIFQG